MDFTSFATKPTLRGRAVLLRPLVESDTEAMAEVLADPELLKMSGSAHCEPELAKRPPAQAYRRWYATRVEQTDRIDLAIIDLRSALVVGEAVLSDWAPENASCGFRMLIGPAGRGRGLGTEATRLLLGYAFERLGLHRVELEIYAFNPRARHVYAAVGFVSEGVKREALRFEQDWVDAELMAILSPQWFSHRGHPRPA